MNRIVTIALVALCLVQAAALVYLWPRAHRIEYTEPLSGPETWLRLQSGERLVIGSNTDGFRVTVWEDRNGIPHAGAAMHWGDFHEDSIYVSPDARTLRLLGGHFGFDHGQLYALRDWDAEGIPTLKLTRSPKGQMHRYTRSGIGWSEVPPEQRKS